MSKSRAKSKEYKEQIDDNGLAFTSPNVEVEECELENMEFPDIDVELTRSEVGELDK